MSVILPMHPSARLHLDLLCARHGARQDGEWDGLREEIDSPSQDLLSAWKQTEPGLPSFLVPSKTQHKAVGKVGKGFGHPTH